MAIFSQTRSGDLSETLASEREQIKDQIRVALPGIIQSFDPSTVTAVVQPAIKSVQCNNDETTTTRDYPLLMDVPVMFPRGGGVTLTFPVKAGDECLVIFADRCIDFWWQNGGVQEPVDFRMHGLSDGFAIVGPQSQVTKISNISTGTAQLRTDDGAAYVELDPQNHDLNLVTPGKLNARIGNDVKLTAAGRLNAIIQGETMITSPSITLNGNVTINGNLTQGMGSAGGTATMNGPVNVTRDVTAGGKSVMTHTHGGVQNGGGSTWGPN